MQLYQWGFSPGFAGFPQLFPVRLGGEKPRNKKITPVIALTATATSLSVRANSTPAKMRKTTPTPKKKYLYFMAVP